MIVCYAYDLQVTLAALLSDSRHRTKQAAVQCQNSAARCSHPLGSGLLYLDISGSSVYSSTKNCDRAFTQYGSNGIVCVGRVRVIICNISTRPHPHPRNVSMRGAMGRCVRLAPARQRATPGRILALPTHVMPLLLVGRACKSL